MKYTVVVPFDWAHRGVDIKHYAKDTVIDIEDENIDPDLFEVAKGEGWIEKTSSVRSEAPANKAQASPGVKETILEKAKKIFK